MQQKIINMLEISSSSDLNVHSTLSFKPFINFLRTKLANDDEAKKELLSYVLNRFENVDKNNEAISLDDLPKHKDLLDLLFVMLTDVTEDEKLLYWGLCLPMTSTMFYGSELFYAILESANRYDSECSLCDADYQEFFKGEMENYYGYILKLFYDFELQKKRPFVRTIKDPHSKFTRHFSISLNTNFVEVKADKPLPQLDAASLRNYELADDGLSQLAQLLPLDMFSFTGFTVTTVKDISQQHALESIRNSIVQNQDYTASNSFPDVVQALKELTGNSQIEFSLLPLFKINGKLVHERDIYNRSALLSSSQKNKLNDQACFRMIEKFVSAPGIFCFCNLEKEVPSEHTVAQAFQKEGIKSYALMPVYYNTKLVGAVEIYSKIKEMINEQVQRLVESALELLGQLMHNSVTALQMEIEAVIKEKYTRMQPSVQWKFTEVAWQHLQQKKSTANTAIEDIEEICFRNVFPLYGAVDVRNSTIERNVAMVKDNTIQVEVLIKVLHLLKEKTNFGLLEEKIFLANNWLLILTDTQQIFNQQVKLTDFFENNISPFINKFTENNDELKGIAQSYYNAIDEKKGEAFQFRRNLEISMTKVISTVNAYFDQLKDEIQKAYPFYFEKFRTDGVEYDIYIGQSISPHIPYSDIFLKNLRLLQLKSMAAIAKYTHDLLPNLSNPVETTQLIFIHSQPIDILFRNDEKRFDVEGAYNIRYHIIKKRIDKVHLRNSDERLTQPGKIALVYFSDQEASEYISYIKYLQGDDVLKDDLEILQLEELSGVSGLKALRVSVNLPK